MGLDFIINGMIYSLIKEFNLFYLSNDDIKEIRDISSLDAVSFSERDPASQKDPAYIALCYTSYFAVFCYRVASCIYIKGDTKNAKLISETAKIKTGIEIHPACKIGKAFVLDHGIGTVIGETTVIGNNCYILQSVILGSSKIANNNNGARHPVIGDNVEIGGFVNIFGKVSIGDNVKISPRTTLKESVPSDTKIVNTSNYTIVKNKKESKIA